MVRKQKLYIDVLEKAYQEIRNCKSVKEALIKIDELDTLERERIDLAFQNSQRETRKIFNEQIVDGFKKLREIEKELIEIKKKDKLEVQKYIG